MPPFFFVKICSEVHSYNISLFFFSLSPCVKCCVLFAVSLYESALFFSIFFLCEKVNAIPNSLFFSYYPFLTFPAPSLSLSLPPPLDEGWWPTLAKKLQKKKKKKKKKTMDPFEEGQGDNGVLPRAVSSQVGSASVASSSRNGHPLQPPADRALDMEEVDAIQEATDRNLATTKEDGENPFDVLERCRGHVQASSTLGPLQLDEPARAAPREGGAFTNFRRHMTRSGRREMSQEAVINRIHLTLPQLTMLMVVRIQRTWRGYITRKTIDLVRRQGGGISDLESRRVIISAIYQRRATTIDTSHFRQLPPSIYGAVQNDLWDHSPYRISATSFLWRYAIISGGCGGVGLCFVLAWHLATTAAVFLIPGWIAMVLRTVFYDGESAVEVNKLVGWVVLFSLICGIGVGMLRVFLVGEAERFAHKLDFVLSVMGMKKSRFITMDQLREFRNRDLGIVKNAVYVQAPLTVMHGLHCFMSLITVLVFDGHMGLVNLISLIIAIVILSFYDQLVISQSLLLEGVAKREGAMRSHATHRGIDDSDYTARNYQLALAKTMLRMTSSYTRTHALVLCTSVMLCCASVILMFYVGAHRVKSDSITVHTFVLSFSYFFFTQISFYRFNYNATGYITARWNMSRLFKLVWHFRGFTDQQTFKEKECAIVAQQEGMKEYRRQPRSVDLCVIVGIIGVLLFSWLVYFAGEKGEYTCDTIKVECHSESIVGDKEHRQTTTLDFGFDFFQACSLEESRAYYIGECAQIYLDNSNAIPKRYRSSITYRGWRDDRRGISKLIEPVATTGGSGQVPVLKPCPVNTLKTAPFRSERYLQPSLHSGIADGDAFGISYDGLDQVWQFVVALFLVCLPFCAIP